MTPALALSLVGSLLAAIAIGWAIHAVARARRRRKRSNWRTDMQRGGGAVNSFRAMMLIDPIDGQRARSATED